MGEILALAVRTSHRIYLQKHVEAGHQESKITDMCKSVTSVLEDADLLNTDASANKTDLLELLQEMRQSPIVRDDFMKRLAAREPAKMDVQRASRIIRTLDSQLLGAAI